jgi:hypothetical protein
MGGDKNHFVVSKLSYITLNLICLLPINVDVSVAKAS